MSLACNFLIKKPPSNSFTVNSSKHLREHINPKQQTLPENRRERAESQLSLCLTKILRTVALQPSAAMDTSNPNTRVAEAGRSRQEFQVSLGYTVRPDKTVTGGGVRGSEEKETEKQRRGALTHSLELFQTQSVVTDVTTYKKGDVRH